MAIKLKNLKMLFFKEIKTNILFKTFSVDFPFRLRHSCKSLVIPPKAETTISRLSFRLLFKIEITLDIDSELATDVPPNFKTFKKLSLFY